MEEVSKRKKIKIDQKTLDHFQKVCENQTPDEMEELFDDYTVGELAQIYITAFPFRMNKNEWGNLAEALERCCSPIEQMLLMNYSHQVTSDYGVSFVLHRVQLVSPHIRPVPDPFKVLLFETDRVFFERVFSTSSQDILQTDQSTFTVLPRARFNQPENRSTVCQRTNSLDSKSVADKQASLAPFASPPTKPLLRKNGTVMVGALQMVLVDSFT
jgi:hypothetical protein